MEDHGPNSEKKWLKEVQILCLDMIILRENMIEVFKYLEVFMWNTECFFLYSYNHKVEANVWTLNGDRLSLK